MTSRDVRIKLAAPFAAGVVKWKPQSVKGNRALAVGYIDARDVEDRLNDVMGIDGWEDEYTELTDGCLLCKLSLYFGDRIVTRSDVGSPSDQPDKGDKKKAAASDALKRAAVKFGIGRYIYKLAHQWVDYDPATKKFAKSPQLPEWALPKPGEQSAESLEPAPPARKELPKPGKEFVERIKAFDEQMAREGLSNSGAVFLHLQKAGEVEGFPDKLDEWDAGAIKYSVECLNKFREKRRADKGKPSDSQKQQPQQQKAAPARMATAAQVKAAGVNVFGDEDGGHAEFCRWLTNDQGIPDYKALDSLPGELLGKLLAELTKQETPAG